VPKRQEIRCCLAADLVQRAADEISSQTTAAKVVRLVFPSGSLNLLDETSEVSDAGRSWKGIALSKVGEDWMMQ
jgi:hypothetical protein